MKPRKVGFGFKGSEAHTLDFVIDDKILLEIKHIPALNFKKQAWRYLNYLKRKNINFSIIGKF